MANEHSRLFVPTGESHFTDPLITTHALLFHTRGSKLAVVTAHAVNKTHRGKGAALQPGRPLTPEDEATLLTMLQSTQGASKPIIFPPNILFADRDFAVWHEPSAVRPMFFMDSGKVSSILTRWPSLVMAVRGRSLHVVAVEGDARPAGETPVFHAPLANVYWNSLVCTGTAKRPLNAGIEAIAGWNAVIYDTCFTHDNHDNVLRAPSKSRKRKQAEVDPSAARSKAVQFWSGRDADLTPFPNDSLNPFGKTLAAWIEAVRVGERHE